MRSLLAFFDDMVAAQLSSVSARGGRDSQLTDLTARDATGLREADVDARRVCWVLPVSRTTHTLTHPSGLTHTRNGSRVCWGESCL